MNIVPELKFTRDVIKREIVTPETRELINDIEIVIKIKNMKNGKSRIHPVTDFLSEFRNNKPKYVADIADNIVIFLNFIYFKLNKKELSDIKYLNIDIGAKFLEDYSIGKSDGTTLRMERNLTKFYYFLASKGILVNLKKESFVVISTKHNKDSIVSPFTGKYKMYSSNKSRPIHNLEPNLFLIFLDKVKEICPQILLGVYMQFFGGLRISEVTLLQYSNLTIKGINARNGMTANIKSVDLRDDLKSAGITQAKKERKQTIIGIPHLIEDIYTQHLKYYKSSSSNAIFTIKNGKAMTSQMYRYYYDKVKNAFIESLINSNNIMIKSQGIYLKNQRWSTHIGRGIFSNLVSQGADNIAEIAVWRGDSSLDASLKYITDNLEVEKKIISLMDGLYQEHLNKKKN